MQFTVLQKLPGVKYRRYSSNKIINRPKPSETEEKSWTARNIQQSYPLIIIDDIKEALILTRENLINPPENYTTDINILPLVIMHDPNN